MEIFTGDITGRSEERQNPTGCPEPSGRKLKVENKHASPVIFLPLFKLKLRF